MSLEQGWLCMPIKYAYFLCKLLSNADILFSTTLVYLLEREQNETNFPSDNCLYIHIHVTGMLWYFLQFKKSQDESHFILWDELGVTTGFKLLLDEIRTISDKIGPNIRLLVKFSAEDIFLLHDEYFCHKISVKWRRSEEHAAWWQSRCAEKPWKNFRTSCQEKSPLPRQH